MSMLATAANFAWWATCEPSRRSFLAALNDPHATQQQILRRYIEQNADTAFGKEHHFELIDSIESFRRRVPLRDYEELTPWIDRIAAGATNILTSEPVLRLTPTSGSTRAKKLIPFTASLQREFNHAISPWIADLFRSDPSLAQGCAYWSITPVSKASDDDFAEDSAYLGGWRQRLVDAILAVPSDVRHIADIDRFRHATMRHLLARRDLRVISVWHPSFLELLLDYAERHWDELVGRKIETGNWRNVWPNLGLISCWADAHAAGAAESLSRRLPHVRIQPKGLLATEAFVTIPFQNAHPLAIRSHFFEFLTDDGRALLADELREGETYTLALTTAGGLYRYKLGDRVKVEGFLSRTPSLKFLGRDAAVVDRFGEKLNEAFVATAIQQTLAALKVESPFAMLAPANDGYTLYIQLASPPPSQLAQRLDLRLQANPHYAYCRRLGQLSAVEVFPIAGDGYAAYTAALTRAGMRLGDIKPAALSDRLDYSQVFANLLARESLSHTIA